MLLIVLRVRITSLHLLSKRPGVKEKNPREWFTGILAPHRQGWSHRISRHALVLLSVNYPQVCWVRLTPLFSRH